MKNSRIAAVLAGLLGGTLLLGGPAAAAILIDFTSLAPWGSVTGTHSVTRTFAGVGRVRVAAFTNGGTTNANLNNSQIFDGGGGPGAYGFCGVGALACARDGFGVRNDDEISISGNERIVVTFLDGPVTLAGFHFLDLFRGEADTSDLSTETAGWLVNGAAGGTLAGTSSHSGLGLSAGYANIAIGTAGVTSLTFFAAMPHNSDFALAAIELVPLPAAVWLFASAFLGLCWLGRRSATSGVGMLPR